MGAQIDEEDNRALLDSILGPSIYIGRLKAPRVELRQFIAQTWGEEALDDWPGIKPRVLRVPNTGSAK